MNYRIRITDEDDRTVVDENLTTVFLIARMQEVIAELRRPQLHRHDVSYGESPMPILAPSADELAHFVNQVSGPAALR